MTRTTTSFQSAAYEQRRDAEFDSLCDALRERLLSNTIPPDDAYWWARIACEEAAGANLSDSGLRGHSF
jgi:hypothetical protein